MARHTNASKKFFKKPKHFGCDNKPNCEGSLFMNKHAQKTETSTSDDFFLKLDSEKVSTFSKTPGYLKKDNSFFKHSKTASYSDHKNQFGSLKNTDTETSKTLGRGHHNQISQNKSKKNHQQDEGANISKKFNERKSLGEHDKHVRNSSPQKKLWQTQRTGKCNTTNSVTSVTKEKPFDKKKYRLQKYSKKYRVQQWEDRRKKAILHEYFKTVNNDNKEGLDVEKIYQESEIQNADEQNDNLSVGTTGRHKPSMSGGTDANTVKQIAQGPKAKKKPFKSVQEELKRMKEDKIAKKEEYLKKKAEKEEARKKYKKEKIERYKKLSRRTKKGQPIMSDRIEMLLEKIQNNLKH